MLSFFVIFLYFMLLAFNHVLCPSKRGITCFSIRFIDPIWSFKSASKASLSNSSLGTVVIVFQPDCWCMVRPLTDQTMEEKRYLVCPSTEMRRVTTVTRPIHHDNVLTPVHRISVVLIFSEIPSPSASSIFHSIFSGWQMRCTSDVGVWQPSNRQSTMWQVRQNYS